MATAATATDPLGYYAILGVAPTASEDEIRRAYRRSVKRWHPDSNGDSRESHERTAQLNEAYDVLSDPDRRAAYDRGAFVHSDPEPPGPVVYPAAVDFGTLRAGDRVTHKVRIANAGGPFSTIRVDPEFGSWFRIAGARGSTSTDVVAELDFEAFVDEGSALPAGKHRETVRVCLDEESADVALEFAFAATAQSAGPAAAHAGSHDPPAAGHAAAPAAGPSTADADLKATAERVALALVTGIFDPLSLVAIGREAGPGWLAFLSMVALGLFGLTGYCARHTRFFTRIDAGSRTVQLLSRFVLFLGKASVVLAIVAIAIAIVIAVLIAILAFALIALTVVVALSALTSE